LSLKASTGTCEQYEARRTQMCDPASEVEKGRGGGQVERIARQPFPMHKVAGMVDQHDDHDQPSKQIH
jgi:hypothetical protein